MDVIKKNGSRENIDLEFITSLIRSKFSNFGFGDDMNQIINILSMKTMGALNEIGDEDVAEFILNKTIRDVFIVNGFYAIAENMDTTIYRLLPNSFAICPDHGFLLSENPLCPKCNKKLRLFKNTSENKGSNQDNRQNDTAPKNNTEKTQDARPQKQLQQDYANEKIEENNPEQPKINPIREAINKNPVRETANKPPVNEGANKNPIREAISRNERPVQQTQQRQQLPTQPQQKQQMNQNIRKTDNVMPDKPQEQNISQRQQPLNQPMQPSQPAMAKPKGSSKYYLILTKSSPNIEIIEKEMGAKNIKWERVYADNPESRKFCIQHGISQAPSLVVEHINEINETSYKTYTNASNIVQYIQSL